jgi:pimeloyl-ACP methyl ester carboxylesterase
VDNALEHLTFPLADVSIHAVAAGPQDGPLVILLHGFPEFWYGWRAQIGPLAEAGFRVTVPDQRGYNQSSKPKDWRAYEVPRLVGDVLGIAGRLGRERFLLAGHDWGGIVAWACAMAHPDRIGRLAILNAPHPSVFRNYMRAHPAQVLRSYYMFFMQLARARGYFPARRRERRRRPPRAAPSRSPARRALREHYRDSSGSWPIGAARARG